MVNRIYKKSAFMLATVLVGAFFYDEARILSSIVVGGVLALLNLRGIAKGVKGLLGSERAPGKMIFASFLRLTALFAVLFILFKKALVNPIGILIGFTAIFTLILIEGWREARMNHPGDAQGKDGDIISPP